MRPFLKEFLLRGMLAASGGPVVLAIIYGTLTANGTVEQFSGTEVCMGILSVTLLAFIVGGMTAVYQMEQLPLLSAILLHGAGLYIAYILVYLLNGWLQRQLIPILVFSGIFLIGYGLIWLVIYLVTSSKAKKLSRALKEQA